MESLDALTTRALRSWSSPIIAALGSVPFRVGTSKRIHKNLRLPNPCRPTPRVDSAEPPGSRGPGPETRMGRASSGSAEAGFEAPNARSGRGIAPLRGRCVEPYSSPRPGTAEPPRPKPLPRSSQPTRPRLCWQSVREQIERLARARLPRPKPRSAQHPRAPRRGGLGLVDREDRFAALAARTARPRRPPRASRLRPGGRTHNIVRSASLSPAPTLPLPFPDAHQGNGKDQDGQKSAERRRAAPPAPAPTSAAILRQPTRHEHVHVQRVVQILICRTQRLERLGRRRDREEVTVRRPRPSASNLAALPPCSSAKPS